MAYKNKIVTFIVLILIEVNCETNDTDIQKDNFNGETNSSDTERNLSQTFGDYIHDNRVKGESYFTPYDSDRRGRNFKPLYTEYNDDESNPIHRTNEVTSAFWPIWNYLKMSLAKLYYPRSTADLFDFLRESYPLPPGVHSPLEEYDFVIIGAGSAGCVVANRLSAGGKWTVLLLEAGAGESILTDIPVLAASLQMTDYTWGYKMEKQEGVCLAMDDQRCYWPRGKAVGGTSVINYMIYTRGNKLDWDRVEEAGNPGWSYNDVLPYYLKSENANLKGLENSPYHRKGGLLSVEDIRYKTPLVDAFLKSAEHLGNKVLDYNQGDQYGFSRIQANTLKGKRHSASKAFLKPIKHRTNLHVLPQSRVTRIIIDEFTHTARSVEFIRNRRRHVVKAKKEIILSAGPIASPQLLMLSGVGPVDHLNEFNIPVIKNLQVGQNMYDHMSYVGLLFLINETGVSPVESKLINTKDFNNWNNNGRGPLTLAGGVEGLGYIKTKVSEELTEYPDIELIFVPGGITLDASQTVRKGMKISDAFFNDVYADVVELDSWTILPMIVHPKSKGFLRLKDTNPFHWPKMYYDYFSDPRDLATFIEAIKYVIKMSEAPPFQKYGSKLYDKHFPTCKQYKYATDEYWECAVRSLSATLHHQVGTCKMGPASDPEAVVNHKLKVHGIGRLRVIDSSIIPKPLTAHTNAPAIMIGEKGADMIRQEWE